MIHIFALIARAVAEAADIFGAAVRASAAIEANRRPTSRDMRILGIDAELPRA